MSVTLCIVAFRVGVGVEQYLQVIFFTYFVIFCTWLLLLKRFKALNGLLQYMYVLVCR